jgi:uncharacterized membrane protein
MPHSAQDAGRVTDVIAGPRARVNSIDLLRGLIIIVMALDHSCDFFGDLAASPTDLATTTPALFFTRWITHLCAPVFFLLTGTGARLSLGERRGLRSRAGCAPGAGYCHYPGLAARGARRQQPGVGLAGTSPAVHHGRTILKGRTHQ